MNKVILPGTFRNAIRKLGLGWRGGARLGVVMAAMVTAMIAMLFVMLLVVFFVMPMVFGGNRYSGAGRFCRSRSSYDWGCIQR
jgi:hypothetical protein